MKKYFIISRYCPLLNSNVNTVVTDMKKIELSTYSNSNNEEYNINNNNYSNSNSVVDNSNNIDS